MIHLMLASHDASKRQEDRPNWPARSHSFTDLAHVVDGFVQDALPACPSELTRTVCDDPPLERFFQILSRRFPPFKPNSHPETAKTASHSANLPAVSFRQALTIRFTAGNVE